MTLQLAHTDDYDVSNGRANSLGVVLENNGQQRTHDYELMVHQTAELSCALENIAVSQNMEDIRPKRACPVLEFQACLESL